MITKQLKKTEKTKTSVFLVKKTEKTKKTDKTKMMERQKQSKDPNGGLDFVGGGLGVREEGGGWSRGQTNMVEVCFGGLVQNDHRKVLNRGLGSV